ncbi:Prorelaxin H1 [Manis javanica]|nr:Prorelaxin H1 [Manis javanica]
MELVCRERYFCYRIPFLQPTNRQSLSCLPWRRGVSEMPSLRTQALNFKEGRQLLGGRAGEFISDTPTKYEVGSSARPIILLWPMSCHLTGAYREQTASYQLQTPVPLKEELLIVGDELEVVHGNGPSGEAMLQLHNAVPSFGIYADMYIFQLSPEMLHYGHFLIFLPNVSVPLKEELVIYKLRKVRSVCFVLSHIFSVRFMWNGRPYTILIDILIDSFDLGRRYTWISHGEGDLLEHCQSELSMLGSGLVSSASGSRAEQVAGKTFRGLLQMPTPALAPSPHQQERGFLTDHPWESLQKAPSAETVSWSMNTNTQAWEGLEQGLERAEDSSFL